MKRVRKLFLGLAVLVLLTSANPTLAYPDRGDCRTIYDPATGEYMFCCPSGCIWL
ncbi:MAG: hypothetical protein ABL934_14565 [Lysobacteraceae bacterium]|jgi:hypothetical protein